MNTQEKSESLADLMEWTLIEDDEGTIRIRSISLSYSTEIGEFGDFDPKLCPYENNEQGLAQFASVLEANSSDIIVAAAHNISYHEYINPTREQLLDEVLRMNGVDL